MTVRQHMLMAAVWTMAATGAWAAAPGAEACLVRDGKPVSLIVIGGARDAQALAQAELVAHLKQMSGAQVPVVAEAELGEAKVADGRLVVDPAKRAAETFVLLGCGDLAQRLGYDAKGVGPGGVIVETRGNTIGIFDVPQERDARGGRAVLVFLEKLGCRNLWPGAFGKVVPARSTVSVGPLSVRHTPKVGQRRIRVQEGPRRFEEGLAVLGIPPAEGRKARQQAMQVNSAREWSLWNGLGGDLGIGGGHAGYGLKGGWTAHGKAHPEWFALQADGTRDMRGQTRWTACVSSTGLIDTVAGTIIADLGGKAKDPISLAPNDGGPVSPCMCENCKKLDPPDAPKIVLRLFEYAGSPKSVNLDYPALTDRMVHFWNAIAERVTKVVPGQRFVVDAYSYYATAPVREKLHPSLIVRYVPSTMEDWQGWKDAGARQIFWRPNNLHSSYALGVLKPAARKTAEALKGFADAGTVAIDIQGIYHNWATQGLEYYMAARFSWDPDQDYEAALDDYCRSGFGAGAAAVKDYFGVVEREIGLPDKKIRQTCPDVSADVIARLRKLLDGAAAATKDDPASSRRVAFLRAGLEYTALTVEAYRLAVAARDGKPWDKEAAKALMDRRWKLMRNLFLKENLAVNTPVVAGHEGPLLWAPLNWTPPQGASAAGDDSDNWLYEDQSQTGKGK